MAEDFGGLPSTDTKPAIEGLGGLPHIDDPDVAAKLPPGTTFLSPKGKKVVPYRPKDPDEAATLPLCLLTRDMQNRKTIDEVFLSIGVQVEPTLETNSLIGLLAHTCTGNWSTIVPASVLETVGIPHRLVSLPLIEPEVAWRCGLVVLERTPQPPLIDALVAETTALGAPFGKFE